MTALDTNVLVRFLVRDDERQARIVLARFRRAESGRERLWVPLVVTLELLWVLDSAYDFDRDEILDALARLRHMAILAFEAEDVVDRTLAGGRGARMDLADLVIGHAARAQGSDTTLTFDRRAARSDLFELLS